MELTLSGCWLDQSPDMRARSYRSRRDKPFNLFAGLWLSESKRVPVEEVYRLERTLRQAFDVGVLGRFAG